MSDLKPCPFCGGEADLIDMSDEYEGEYWVAHQCPSGASTETYSYETAAEAIAAWNTRVAYEMEGWFYLPKPKQQLFSYTTGFTFDDLSLKATGAVDVYALADAVRKWQEEELNQHIVERICEVFRPERTCDAEYRSGGYGIGGWYCLACGGYMHDDLQQDMAYCPNCGAKVIGENE